MKALFTFCTLCLLWSHTSPAQSRGTLHTLNSGLNFVFVHTTERTRVGEYGGMPEEVRDHRFAIPVIVFGYGAYTVVVNSGRDVSFGIDYDARIGISLSGETGAASSSYFFFGGGFGLLCRQGAGSGLQRTGFGFGGGIGVQTGLEVFSNEIVMDTYGGIPVRPQLLAEVSYAPSRKHTLTLRLYTDILAKGGETNNALGRSSVRQAGFLLKYEL